MPQIRELLDEAARQALLQAPGPIGKGTLYGTVDFKAAKAGDDGKLYFTGYANTVHIDRQKHVVLPKAFRKSIKGFLRNNPQVFYNHDWNVSIGGIEEARIDDTGLWVRGYVQPVADENGDELYGSWGEFLRMVRGQVKRGQIRTLSIGFRIVESQKTKIQDGKTEVEVLEIREVDLMEISLVTVPANRESVIEVQKGMAALYGEQMAAQLCHIDGTPAEPDTYLAAEMGEEPDPTALSDDAIRSVLSGLVQKLTREQLAELLAASPEAGDEAGTSDPGAEPQNTGPVHSGANDLEVVSLRDLGPRVEIVSIRKG